MAAVDVGDNQQDLLTVDKEQRNLMPIVVSVVHHPHSSC